jgi:hypothetical protein
MEKDDNDVMTISSQTEGHRIQPSLPVFLGKDAMVTNADCYKQKVLFDDQCHA